MNKKAVDDVSQVIIPKKEPFVLDSITVMQYSPDELVEKNGKPLSDTIFTIDKINRGKTVLILWNDSIRESNIMIREQIWEIDSVNRVAIWFTQNKDSVWKFVSANFYNSLE